MKRNGSKRKTSSGDSHCDFEGLGMGDNYGTGIKNKVGRMREDSLGWHAVSKSKLKVPPRSLA